MSRQERGRRSVVRRDESSARRSASLVVIASLAIGAPANRAAHLAFAAIPVPTTLEPGDKYHLAFVSTLVTPAISADIATYNSVAQDAANSAGMGASEGVTWTAIASTALVNARENAPIGAETPIYNMIGQRVADGFADMWDGQIDATLARDQFGNPSNVDAWTG